MTAQLDYAVHTPWHRRPRFRYLLRKTLWLLLIAALAAPVVYYAPHVYRRCAILHNQSAAMNPPALGGTFDYYDCFAENASTPAALTSLYANCPNLADTVEHPTRVKRQPLL